MRNVISEELRQFMLDWHGHKPVVPNLENPSTRDIKRNLGYLPLRLPFEVPHREMLEEARALKEFYVYHRSTGHHRGWRSIVLHGLSSVHSQ